MKVPGDLTNRSMACHYHVVVLEPLGAGCGCPGSVRGICIADVDSRRVDILDVTCIDYRVPGDSRGVLI